MIVKITRKQLQSLGGYSAIQDCPDHWIEIVLVDEAGRPCVSERYDLTSSDGSVVRSGTLNELGEAREEGLPAGTYKVSFIDIDVRAWERV